jgi:hypothetical protein
MTMHIIPVGRSPRGQCSSARPHARSGGALAGSLGRVPVVLDQGGDDCALAEEHPPVRDLGGSGSRAASARSVAEVVPTAALVGEDRVVGRMAGIGEFDGGVDEGAAANRRPVEPVVEDIENSQQPLRRVLGSCRDLPHGPGEEPAVQHVGGAGRRSSENAAAPMDQTREAHHSRCRSTLARAAPPTPTPVAGGVRRPNHSRARIKSPSRLRKSPSVDKAQCWHGKQLPRIFYG